MNSFIPPFTVHSKPILPFDLSVRHLPFEEMQSLPSSQTHHHHPELYRPPSPGSLNIVPGTSLNSQHHTHGYDTTWKDDSNPGSGYYPVSSATQPAPISTHQPCQPHIAKSSPSNPARDSILRQGPRQRTAHACEKCRDRKTKCSGERPVCLRCATRGLTCNYSPREMRGRGASNARLRGTMSANDLRFARVVDSPSQRGRYKVTPSSKSTSPNSSPIHSTFPLSITSQFPQWEGHWSPIQTARDPRRVQSYSTLSMTEETAQSIPHPVSYDLTPRPGEFSAGTFDEMLSQSVYPLMPNRRLDLHLDHVKYQSDNSPCSEPRSATESHFSFSSASSGSGSHSRPSSFLSVEDILHNLGRTSTPTSSASASASSSSSPSSAFWNAELDTTRQNEIHQLPMLPPHDQFAESKLNSSITYANDCQQYTESHALSEGGGDSCLQTSPSDSSLMSQYVVPGELLDGVDWETFAFLHC